MTHSLGLAEHLFYVSRCSVLLTPQPAPQLTIYSIVPCSAGKLESCAYNLRSGYPLPFHPIDGHPRFLWVENCGVIDATHLAARYMNARILSLDSRHSSPKIVHLEPGPLSLQGASTTLDLVEASWVRLAGYQVQKFSRDLRTSAIWTSCTEVRW